mmetsp:Transcript_19271/g.61320  ORF Transcript_19271/g.61320 Transcript_19271/m.61320 type:complete len:238 (+) Transcript_19271:3-716(+)
MSYGPPPYQAPPSYGMGPPTGSPAARPALSSVEEVKLWRTSAERRRFDDMANLYSILKATDMLERAYASDYISADDYSKACSKLISQYKTTEDALKRESVVSDLASFVRDYSVDCPRALDRLMAGVPATVLHQSSSQESQRALVAETVQYFITAMDALKLDTRAVDEIFPLVSDLSNSVNKVQGLPADFSGRAKLSEWLRTLNGMRASDDLSDEQVRQLGFDLDQSYSEFMRSLQSK